MFFGIFILDVIHSGQLIGKLKKFAEENTVILKYEGIKDHIRNYHLSVSSRYHFFMPFRSEHPLGEHLKEMLSTLEKQRRKK